MEKKYKKGSFLNLHRKIMKWYQDDRIFINHDEVEQVTWQEVDMEVEIGIRTCV